MKLPICLSVLHNVPKLAKMSHEFFHNFFVNFQIFHLSRYFVKKCIEKIILFGTVFHAQCESFFSIADKASSVVSKNHKNN